GHDSLHVEEREAERWCEKAGLEIDCDQDQEPRQEGSLCSDIARKIRLREDWSEDRQDDETNFQPIEEETKEENENHDEDEKSPRRIDTKHSQQLYDRVVSAECAESVGESRGRQRYEKHHSVGTRRRVDHERQVLSAKSPFNGGQQESASAANARCLSGGRKTKEDRAQNQAD